MRLVRTCEACPEQYDVYKETRKVGYLRLRYGYFRAHMYHPLGKAVYESETIGDGVFDDSERGRHLMAAMDAIGRELERETK